MQWRRDTNSYATISANILSPRFDLPVQKTDATGAVTTFNYDHPDLGLVTSTVADAKGLKLTSSTTYETQAPGGYYRPLKTVKPNGAATTYIYYGMPGKTATGSNPCVSGHAGSDAGRSTRRAPVPRARVGWRDS